MEPVFNLSGTDIGAYEHLSFVGGLGRWIRVRGTHGPVELYCSWNFQTRRWELGEGK